MATQIQLRRFTAAYWTSHNPILGEGEPGYEKDTHKIKVGDGATNWNALPYALLGIKFLTANTVANQLIYTISGLQYANQILLIVIGTQIFEDAEYSITGDDITFIIDSDTSMKGSKKIKIFYI